MCSCSLIAATSSKSRPHRPMQSSSEIMANLHSRKWEASFRLKAQGVAPCVRNQLYEQPARLDFDQNTCFLGRHADLRRTKKSLYPSDVAGNMCAYRPSRLQLLGGGPT